MRNTFKTLFIVLVVGLFIMRPALSYADWNGHNGDHGHDGNHGHDGGHGHDYGHRDHSFVSFNLGIWPNGYYYGSSYYPSSDEVLVSSPIYQPVVINGITYYLNDGTYYIYNGYGYQVVAPPVMVVQQPVAVVQPPEVVAQAAPAVTTPSTTSDTADSFTINIPNNKGGYTAVTLKKSGNGFIGPQGEFYPEFPKVSQLEVIYGK